MQIEKEFNLIKGTFKPTQAIVILLELYNYKIGFHEREKFSNLERYGKDVLNSESRIVELKFERKELEQLLKTAQKGSLQLSIECIIKIKEKNDVGKIDQLKN
ncbi:MAG: hypothetical protein ABI315_04615 [Bacteroidia bacterium]